MAKDTPAEPKAPEREAPTGGKNPHKGDHYQDQWPPNPPASESAEAKAKEDEEKEKELHG